ncbi:hydroxyacid dehydrogenase [Candidatus Acetothermia bacterium]|nr:hydroxyacid dehydrogenase [Candidatus Acetothermia bacterium]MBI3644021.1 hydroxyacid dehydrogenase [Candidatus Acetothermia bacterium]
MNTYRVLVSDRLHPDAVNWLKSQDNFQVTSEPELTPEGLLKSIASFDALIVRSRTKVTKEVIAGAKNLKVIGRAGTGLDNIDVTAAQKAKIQVLNSPGANANAVAELTLGLIIALARRLPSAFLASDKPKEYGWELRDKTLGILGLGQIGTRVAGLASAFGMSLLGFDVDPKAGPKETHYTRVELDDLLRESDVITIHVPLLDATRHFIDAKALDKMKAGVWIINTARADLVDEPAMLRAIQTDKVRGYAADAIGLESLLRHPTVIHTPHIGAQTGEAQERAGIEIVERVAAALKALG